MYAECRHLLPSGRKCTDPLIQNSAFCWFHGLFRQSMYSISPRPGTPFRLPSLEDTRGLLIALTDVTRAMGEKRITQKEAGTYLYAINIAKSLIPRRPSVTRKPVRTVCYDNDGLEMAEAVDACEPPRDCLNCEKQSTCDWFEYYEDQVEELEEQMAEEEEQKKLQAQRSQQGADSGQAASDPQQQPSERTQPRRGKYDHELPNVRALYEELDRKAEEEKLRIEQQAKAEEERKRAEQQTRAAGDTSDPHASEHTPLN